MTNSNIMNPSFLFEGKTQFINNNITNCENLTITDYYNQFELTNDHEQNEITVIDVTCLYLAVISTIVCYNLLLTIYRIPIIYKIINKIIYAIENLIEYSIVFLIIFTIVSYLFVIKPTLELIYYSLIEPSYVFIKDTIQIIYTLYYVLEMSLYYISYYLLLNPLYILIKDVMGDAFMFFRAIGLCLCFIIDIIKIITMGILFILVTILNVLYKYICFPIWRVFDSIADIFAFIWYGIIKEILLLFYDFIKGLLFIIIHIIIFIYMIISIIVGIIIYLIYLMLCYPIHLIKISKDKISKNKPIMCVINCLSKIFSFLFWNISKGIKVALSFIAEVILKYSIQYIFIFIVTITIQYYFLEEELPSVETIDNIIENSNEVSEIDDILNIENEGNMFDINVDYFYTQYKSTGTTLISFAFLMMAQIGKK